MGDGILSAVNMLERARQEAVNAGQPPRERVIIAMTDGEANVGLDPKIAAKLAAEKHIKIHTVGIGKE
jgi:Mg-chelatase subunit ChlD